MNQITIWVNKEVIFFHGSKTAFTAFIINGSYGFSQKRSNFQINGGNETVLKMTNINE